MGVEKSAMLRAPGHARRAALPRRVYGLLMLTALASLFPALMLLPLPLLRAPLGLLLALLAPGYALTEVIFPRRALDGVARAALSFGLSVVMLPLLALVLNTLPWGLGRLPVSLSLCGLIVLLCGLALWRQASSAAEVLPTPSRRWWGGLSGAAKLGSTAAALAIACALIGGTARIAADLAARPTEFYVLGRAGLSEDYPRQAAPGQQLTATVGIDNQEPGERTFRVEVWAIDRDDPSRRALAGRAGPLILSAGQRLEQAVSWRMPWPGDDQTAELLLFTESSPEPYRRLRLSVAVSEPAP